MSPPADELPGSSTSNSLSSVSSLKDEIPDVVSFSLCSLCAIKLNYLYPEHYHELYRTNAVHSIVKHFGLPEKVINCINEFTNEDEFTFLSSIKQNYQHGPFKLIEELVLISVNSGIYDARSHYLIIEVAELLGIPRDLVEMHCESVYSLLLKAQATHGNEKSTHNNDDDPESQRYREKRDTRKKIKKYLMIGLASIGGGAVIGVTGGLAAPIVASAFAGVIGAGSIVMSSAAAGVIGSLFGVAGAGLTASKMNKRIGDLEEFSFESLERESEQTSLIITIAISGWITDEGSEQFVKQWKYLRHTKEQYCLCYESKYLLELSRAMDYLLSFVVSYATQEALKYTFLASVMAAIAWPTALISIANIIDNPWDCCIGRSAQAGKHLADVLMSRQQGKRPSSLIGFSLGARVIFFCLQELAQRKDSEGMIGDVVLLGAPVTASADQWKPIGRIVSGRIINGYSSSDWLLKFLYRTSSAAIHVAGLEEIQVGWEERRLKNIDLTPLVSGHMDYYKKLNEILDYVNIRTVVRFEDDIKLITIPTAVTTQTANVTTAAVAAAAGTGSSSSGDSGIERSASAASTNISSSLGQQQQQTLADPCVTLPTSAVPSLSFSPEALTPSSSSESNLVAQQVQQQQQHQQRTVRPVTRNKQVDTRQKQQRQQQRQQRQQLRPTAGNQMMLMGGYRCRPSSLARKRATDLRAAVGFKLSSSVVDFANFGHFRSRSGSF